MPDYKAAIRYLTADGIGGPKLPFSKDLLRRFSPAIAQRAGSALIPYIPNSRWLGRGGTEPLGRLGELEVRLAASIMEVRRAQALRYRVFYEEMSAVPDLHARQMRRDVDRFDRYCDHLLVLDHARKRFGFPPDIVGTYRLLRQDVAERNGGFYGEGEFDLAPLLARKSALRFLELGRSCVLPEYRNKRTLELLWHGIWVYVLRHGLDVMIGCGSLTGTEPEQLALPLSFLHHSHRAPPEWSVAARDDRRIEMRRMPASAIDARAALRALPPLIKGYLRLGAFVGDGAVIDWQFGTTDVAIVLPVAGIARRYVGHYGADAGRYAVRRVEAAPLAVA
jgi:putative hemolysin